MSDAKTLGQLLAKAVHEYGIGGHILAIRADVDEAVITTTIEGSDGHPMLDEDGRLAEAVWTVPTRRARP